MTVLARIRPLALRLASPAAGLRLPCSRASLPILRRQLNASMAQCRTSALEAIYPLGMRSMPMSSLSSAWHCSLVACSW